MCFFVPSLLNCEAITPSETVTISDNSAAMSPSPDFNRRRDSIATRGTRANVSAAQLR
jgi:hypothetical protein